MYLYLIEEFKNLNQEVPNIHYGGCCIFAENLYNVLIKSGKKPKKPKIIVLSCTPTAINDLIIGKKVSPSQVDITHVIIKLGKIYLDNNGIYNNVTDILHYDNKAEYDEVFVPLKTLKYINQTFENWNPRFDREKINVVEKTFKEIEKNLVNNLVIKK